VASTASSAITVMVMSAAGGEGLELGDGGRRRFLELGDGAGRGNNPPGGGKK